MNKFHFYADEVVKTPLGLAWVVESTQSDYVTVIPEKKRIHPASKRFERGMYTLPIGKVKRVSTATAARVDAREARRRGFEYDRTAKGWFRK